MLVEHNLPLLYILTRCYTPLSLFEAKLLYRVILSHLHAPAPPPHHPRLQFMSMQVYTCRIKVASVWKMVIEKDL